MFLNGLICFIYFSSIWGSKQENLMFLKCLCSEYHNHTLQIKPHRGEEPKNIKGYKAPGRQSKAISSVLPSKMIAKLERTLSTAYQNLNLFYLF